MKRIRGFLLFVNAENLCSLVVEIEVSCAGRMQDEHSL